MRSLIIFIFSLCASFFSAAQASTGISYQGRLLLPSGEAVKALTQFKIQIRSPGNENCLMYEETTSRDLSLTDGVFSITIGDGTGSRTDTLGLGLDAIFANRSKFVFTANCAIVTDYTPNAADGRRLQVSFNDGTFAGWEDLPVQNIGFAPISIESVQVGGFKASHLLRVADVSGVPQSVAALSPAYFAELVALAAGTSTNYVKTGSAVSGDTITTGTIGGATTINTTGTIKASSMSATTGGFNTVEVWKADNSNKVSIKASNAQAANYTLTLPTGTGTSGQILSTDGTGILSWSTAASIGAASGDVSGTYPALTVTKIQGQDVSATTPLTGQAMVFNGTAWAGKNFGIGDLKTAAGATQFSTAACTAAQTLTWSSLTDVFTCADITGLKSTSLAAGGTVGQVLKINASGDLEWDADAVGGGGTPGGADKQIQINTAGAFAGSAELTYPAAGTLFLGPAPAAYSTGGQLYINDGSASRAEVHLRNTTTGNGANDGASVAQVFNDMIIDNYESGYISFLTTNSERMRILAGGNVGIGVIAPSEKLEVNGNVKATGICIGTDCKTAWPSAGSSGTVTDVTSANAYLTVATSTTTPALTLNVGTAANTVAAGDDSRFTDARAPNGSAGGDLGGTYPNPGVTKIRGNSVTVGTIPGADIGKVYRWDGTNLTAAFLNFGDLRTAAGAQQLTAACAANEKIQWSVITDAFTCQSIGSLNASAITAGTIDSARLPASANYWQDGGSNRIYYSAANVGIGAAAPVTKLEVAGALRVGTEVLTCDTTTTGAMRYVAATGGVEICNGTSWALPTNGYALPASAIVVMDVCPSGWTDVGATGTGPGSATCNGITCRRCQGPATATLFPVGAFALFESCPSTWTNSGIGVSSALAGIDSVAYTSCAPTAASLIPAGARMVMEACPASWTDLGAMNGGPFGANCGGGSCHACEAPGSARTRSIIAGTSTVGGTVVVTAGTSTEGVGGAVVIKGGNGGTSTAVSRVGGDITMLAGSGASDGNGGSVVINSGIGNGAGTPGNIVLNTTSGGKVGIGTATPASTLDVVGTVSASSSVTSPIGMFGSMTVGLTAVTAASPWTPVISMQNTSTNGYSGAFLTDDGGTNRGLVGFANSGAVLGNSVVFGSLDATTPVIFAVQSQEAARISPADGFFGIGTTNPLTPLHVKTTGAAAVASFQNATGTCTITPNTSSLSCSSDIRLKRNIENILGLTALNKIIQLQAKTYEWKGGDNSRHIGYIAQEAEKIVPELVTEDANGYKQISYSAFVPLLSEAIKEVHKETESQKRNLASINEEKAELQKQVEDLQKKNEALEQKNKAFEARLKKLEDLLAK